MKKFKKLLSLLSVAVMVVSAFPVTARAEVGSNTLSDGVCSSCGGTYTNGFCSNADCDELYQKPDGSGTAEKPYEIDNAGKLYWFAEQANNSTDSDGVYDGCAVLTADITVNPGTFAADGGYTENGATAIARVWSPICNAKSDVAYSGTFDGQNYSISGLYYNRNCEDDEYNVDYAGLFGCVGTGGMVKNVTVKSSYFAAVNTLGAIVGTNDGTVKNCHGRDNYLVGVMIDDIGYSNCIGGVVGWNGGTLDQLSNIGGAVSGDEEIGGVVGYNYSDFDIQNCYNTAPVTGTSNVGGVVGTVWIDTTDITIRFCYNVGTVSGKGNLGGIVGRNDSMDYTLTFRGCYYQDATGLSGVGNDWSATGITAMSKDQFTSGEAAGQIDYEWGQYVDEFNKKLSAGEKDKILKENVWFMDPVTKLPAFDGDIVNSYGKIQGTRPSAGNGTEVDPYQIGSGLDLWWFIDVFQGNHDYSLCAKLTADIIMNPGTFDADGNYTPGEDEETSTEAEDLNTVDGGNRYFGTFDGQGHTIYGLYYGNTYAQGLFDSIGAGGTVKNVIIANSYFGRDKTEPVDMGAIAAYNYGTVENCGVLDSVYLNATDTTYGFVGGVVGVNESGGTVKNCFSAAYVTGDGTCGGVVGLNDDGAVTNCYYITGTASAGVGSGSGDTVAKTADEFASGEVAYLLQAGISSVTTTDDNGNEVTTTPLVWGQTSSEDGATPILTSNEEYRVLPVKSGDTIVNYSVLHMGDLNNSGEVDIYDYQQLVNIALSESNTKKETEKHDLNGDDSQPAYREKADFDGDGVVDVLDVCALERMLSGHRVRV